MDNLAKAMYAKFHLNRHNGFREEDIRIFLTNPIWLPKHVTKRLEMNKSKYRQLGKMFIGGLSWQTTQEGLKEYFSKFGDVKECMVMRDPVTKRSRGFGFVTFVDQTGVDKVLAQSRHELDSKTVS
ncbi:UNVERIFIED_CONTAM: hypothetical protein FKN15_011570 [Acipenser sinensis]